MLKKMFKNNIFLINYIQKNSKYYLLLIVLVSLTAFAGPMSTVLAPKLIMDLLLNNPEDVKIINIIIFVVIINFIRIIVKTLFNEIFVPTNQLKVKKGINKDLMKKAISLDLKCFDSSDFYNKYTRALNQADSGIIDLINIITNLCDRFIFVITVLSIITILDPLLIILSVICVFILFYYGKKESENRYNTTKEITYEQRKMDYSRRVFYLPEYSKEIKVFNIGNLLRTKYMQSINNIEKILTEKGKINSKIIITNEGFRVIILQLITMIYLVMQIKTGNLKASAFIALFLATTQLSYEFFSFANSINGFYKSSLYIDDLIYILNYKNEIENIGNIKIDVINQIKLNKVKFSYEGKSQQVINNLSFELHKGDKIAIIGHNGAGKSTLIKLLMRLYDVKNGEILYNNINIKDIDLTDLRAKIGIVYQDFKNYSLSIAENVLLKEIENEDEVDTVKNALKSSDLYDYINQLDDGINTILTKEFDEKGINLSGGENQKLALARIFANKDKQVLILDEVSSALDPISEHKINSKIMEYSKDKILIIISHRLYSTKDVDRIFYMENGEILETGSHEELMNNNGKYSQMFRLQMEKYTL